MWLIPSSFIYMCSAKRQLSSSAEQEQREVLKVMHLLRRELWLPEKVMSRPLLLNTLPPFVRQSVIVINGRRFEQKQKNKMQLNCPGKLVAASLQLATYLPFLL